jgi:tRNA A22 N-methylase
MTLAKWDEAVRVAKIRLKLDPNDFSVIKGKLLKEAQVIYKILLNDN